MDETPQEHAVDLSITVAEPLVFEDDVLPAGIQGQPYDVVIQMLGGAGDFTWSIIGGGLPPGLSLSAEGVVMGEPTTPGTFGFTVEVSDESGQTVSKACAIKVIEALVIQSPSRYVAVAARNRRIRGPELRAQAGKRRGEAAMNFQQLDTENTKGSKNTADSGGSRVPAGSEKPPSGIGLRALRLLRFHRVKLFDILRGLRLFVCFVARCSAVNWCSPPPGLTLTDSDRCRPGRVPRRL